MPRSTKLHVLEYELPVRVVKDRSGGFVAKSPAWSDCYAQGDSIDEVTNEIAAVASALIELYKEEGLNIPLKKKRTLSTILKIPVFSTSWSRLPTVRLLRKREKPDSFSDEKQPGRTKFGGMKKREKPALFPTTKKLHPGH